MDLGQFFFELGDNLSYANETRSEVREIIIHFRDYYLYLQGKYYIETEEKLSKGANDYNKNKLAL